MPTPYRRLVAALSLPLLLAVLAACAPAASLFTPPTFRLVDEGTGLLRLDPPGVGAGAAVFRLELEVGNPNPVGVRLAALDGALFVNDHRAASSRFDGGLDLPANGSARLALEVSVPLADAPALLGDLAGLIAGAPTRYRLDATVALDLFGARQSLPTATLAEGTVTQPLALVAPRIAFRPDRSGLRELGLQRAVIDISADLTNPAPLGYLFDAPALELDLGGRAVARAGLIRQPVPAQGSATMTLSFEFSPAALGIGLASRLQGLAAGGSLEASVSGGFALEVPGVTRRSFPAGELVAGALR